MTLDVAPIRVSVCQYGTDLGRSFISGPITTPAKILWAETVRLFIANEKIKLDPLVNQLVRFKLHELAETKEGIIRAFDEHGYWIEGGSLADYLQTTSPGAVVASTVRFVEHKRIQWIQKV